MKQFKSLLFLALALPFARCGSKTVQQVSPAPFDSTSSRIDWESGSKIVSDPNDNDYHGYARIIELRNGNLMLTYFDAGLTNNGGIMARYSMDGGDNWGPTEVIHPNTSSHEVNNPESFEMSNGTLLVLTNLRPYKTGESHYFEIGLIRKPLGGQWSTITVLYRADNLFNNGCWEPKMIELPDGSMEIYFANENNFRENDDQEISKLYSTDKGQTWKGPIRFSYAPGARDGMPVSVVSKGSQPMVITAIEDNSKGGRFSISILESPLQAGAEAATRLQWVVPGEMADNTIYTGAPYLAVLPNGSLLLTGQTDYQRPKRSDPLHISVPFIAICEPGNYRKFRMLDANPFRIDPAHEGLWNSVAVVNSDKVLLLTSTQSGNGMFKVCMKRGSFKAGQ